MNMPSIWHLFKLRDAVISLPSRLWRSPPSRSPQQLVSWNFHCGCPYSPWWDMLCGNKHRTLPRLRELSSQSFPVRSQRHTHCPSQSPITPQLANECFRTNLEVTDADLIQLILAIEKCLWRCLLKCFLWFIDTSSIEKWAGPKHRVPGPRVLWGKWEPWEGWTDFWRLS